MADLTQLAQSHIDLTSAYDERKRLFDKLRNLYLDDDARQEAVAEYAVAAERFDTLRTMIIEYQR